MTSAVSRFKQRSALPSRENNDAISAGMSRFFQILMCGTYLSLLYKKTAIGLLLLILSAFSLFLLRRSAWRVSWPAAALAIAYVAMATVTAFLVDAQEGFERTIQGGITIAAAMAFAKYLWLLSPEQRWTFFRCFAFLNAAILAHVILFHIMHKQFFTWKYLLETKFVFSAIILCLFLFEDALKAKSMTLWATMLAGTTGIILLSGERKAYLLLVVAYLLSRARLMTVSAVAGCALVLGSAFVAIQPDSYVAHQLGSGKVSSTALPDRYFFSVSSIANHSDVIRAFVNRNAERLFWQHPILGTGSTGYVTWARKTYGSLRQSRGLSMNVHGERYRVPAESGLVGVAIALAYLGVVGSRFARYWSRNGGREADAFVRAPSYALALLVCYIYFEALDTTMLMLILLVGFMAASLSLSREGGALRHRVLTRPKKPQGWRRRPALRS